MRKRPAGFPTNLRFKRQNQKELPRVLIITYKEIAKEQATAARTNHQAPCVNYN